MPLNLATNDGDFTPYIKYNAKAGRWYIRPQGATADVEVINPRLAIDFANIRTGWFYYAEGSGPEKVYDPSPSQAAPKPVGGKKFKRGFEVMVFGGDELSGIGKVGLREWSSTAANAIAAVLKMYDLYENDVGNAGKIPFFGCTGVTPINGAFGTNYEPNFKLLGWVERAKVTAFDEYLNAHPPATSAPTASATASSLNGSHPNAPGFVDGSPAPSDLNDDIPF